MKWTDKDAGKIQCNRFNEAYRELSRLKNTLIELYNHLEDGQVKKDKTILLEPFGNNDNPEIDKLIEAIGNKYNWTVSRDNVNQIITDTKEATKQAWQYVPVVDKRKSLEQLQEQAQQYQERLATEREKSDKQEELKKRFKDGRLVIIQKCVNESDSMTDYYAPCVAKETYILANIPEGRRELSILKAVCKQCPSLASIEWKEHRENWSMNHFGYSLTSGPIDDPEFEAEHKRKPFYMVEFASIKYHGYHEFWPEQRQAPAPGGNGKVAITHNTERDGIEVRFSEKPSEDILSMLKIKGFRWSRPQRLWYRRYNQDLEKELQEALTK